MSQLNVNVGRYRVRRAMENYTLRNMVRFRANVCNFIDDLCGQAALLEIRYHNHTGWRAQSLFFEEFLLFGFVFCSVLFVCLCCLPGS